MATGAEAHKPTIKEEAQLAQERARERVKTGRWDLSLAIWAYAVLGTVVLLRLEGVAIEIVASIAIFGLAIIWLIGWRRGRQLFKRFYTEELRHLHGLSAGKEEEISVASPLTPREMEILGHVARGYSNKEIARMLQIGEQTTKNHVSSILSKLSVYDRTQAVVMAMHYGWITSQLREPSEPATSDKT